ncbi:MAG: glycosyltransferase, partial [Siphonobacter aquaeclarae]|nr:glycosyltransferase [Siphonobacter aquaeclarae]
MRKRLAFISEHASPLALCGGTDAGGQNVVVAELSRHLARLGYSVDIFTRKDDPVLPEIVQWDRGVRVVHIPAGPPEPIPKEELLPYMDAFREGILRFSEKEGNPYRLIHAHFFMSALVAADIRKQTGIPFVVTFHALGMVRREIQKEADRFPASRIDIEKRVIAEADCVVALCPQDRRDLIRLYEADSTRIEQIPNGVDPEVFSARDKAAARERLGWTADERVLLQLGRMVPRKGIDTVIE